MSFYPARDRYRLTRTDHALAGFASGLMTRTVVQPFDVIKIRCQLQHESIRRSKFNRIRKTRKPPVGKYTTPWRGLVMIVREEGVRALWKGITPGQFLSVTYSSTAFYSFEAIKGIIHARFPNPQFKHHKELYEPLVDFSSGFLSGKISCVASYPFDILRTRMASQGWLIIYPNTMHAIKHIYRKDGILGFYRGVFPAMLTFGPQTGLQFAGYHFLIYLSDYNREDDQVSAGHVGAMHTMLCGFIAGFVAKIAVFPFDLFKKRLQVVGFEEARWTFGLVRTYSGMGDLVRSIAKYERLGGFYKGLWASLIKSGVSTGCTFLFYEQACRTIKHMRS